MAIRMTCSEDSPVMRFQTYLICIALSFGLGGCATSYEYSKTNRFDEAQLNSDMSECKGVAEKRTGNREALEVINTCMEGRGYAVTKKGFDLW